MNPQTPDLSRIRCLTHGQREAVARCGSCGNFFCRECIVEHDGIFTCAGCLSEKGPDATAETSFFLKKALIRMTGLLLGGLVSWSFFVLLGKILLFYKHAADLAGDW